jgi:hypothetical protein
VVDLIKYYQTKPIPELIGMDVCGVICGYS